MKQYHRLTFRYRMNGDVEVTRWIGRNGKPHRFRIWESTYNRFVELANSGYYQVYFPKNRGDGHWCLIRNEEAQS